MRLYTRPTHDGEWIFIGPTHSETVWVKGRWEYESTLKPCTREGKEAKDLVPNTIPTLYDCPEVDKRSDGFWIDMEDVDRIISNTGYIKCPVPSGI